MPDGGLDEATVRRVIHDELQPVQKSIDKIKRCLEGPEGEPDKGVIVRLDRIEQKEKSRSFWIGTALVAGVTALGHGIVNWIMGRNN